MPLAEVFVALCLDLVACDLQRPLGELPHLRQVRYPQVDPSGAHDFEGLPRNLPGLLDGRSEPDWRAVPIGHAVRVMLAHVFCYAGDSDIGWFGNYATHPEDHQIERSDDHLNLRALLSAGQVDTARLWVCVRHMRSHANYRTQYE